MSSVTFRGITIHRQDVLRALAAFDQQYPVSFKYGGWDDPGNQHYFIRVGGRAYPPRFILSVATGMEPEVCAEEGLTYRVFDELGFEVVDLTWNQTWRHKSADNNDETNPETHPISDLGLSVRSYNALVRRGITTIAQLAVMSDEDLFRVHGLGQKSVDEIRFVLADFSLKHPLVQGQVASRKPLPENSDGHLPGLYGVQIDLRDSHPSVVETNDDRIKPKANEPVKEPDGQVTPISVLDLPARAHNALARSHIETVGQLARMSDEDLFKVKNLGAKSIGQIRPRLVAYLDLHPLQPLRDSGTFGPQLPTKRSKMAAQSLVEQQLLSKTKHLPLGDIPVARLALSSDAEEKIVKAGIRSIGDLLGNVSIRFDPNMLSHVQERTRQYLEWLLTQDSEVLKEESANRSISPLHRLALENTTVEAMITDWFSARSDRQRDVLRLRYGLDGKARTLEEVGQEVGLTRERVRQLESKALMLLRSPSAKQKALPVAMLLKQIVKDHGGVVRLRTLIASARHTYGLKFGGVAPSGLIQLVAQVFQQIVVAKRQRIVHLASCSPDLIYAVQWEMVRILEDRSVPLSTEVLLAEFRLTKVWFEHQADLTNRFIVACLRSSNRLDRNDSRLYVLKKASWHRKSVVINVLREIGEPAHYSVITKRFNELVGDGRQLTDHNLHAYVGRFPDIFARVGHGVFGLTEWGLSNDGKVANTAYKVLRDAGGHLHIDVLTQAVLKTWCVNPPTVHVAVESDERFIRIGRGIYALRESITGEISGEATYDFGEIYAQRLALWQQELDQRNSPTGFDAQSEVDALRSLGAGFFNE